MGEKDYIELNTLLAKLRVNCLKIISNPEVDSKIREKNYKIIRNIDNIRNYMPLQIDEGNISIIK